VTANVWRATIAALLCVLAASARAGASAQGQTPGDRPRVLEVFVRDGCPHCADAKAFLVDLAREDPALAIVYREVDRDPLAREELVRVFDRAGMWPPGVPTFVVDGEMLVGFSEQRRVILRVARQRTKRHVVEYRGKPVKTLRGGLAEAAKRACRSAEPWTAPRSTR